LEAEPEARTGVDAAEEFMAVAAHDLRNPIAVMRASAQMAQRQLGRGELDTARGRLEAIVDQTDRLVEMIETFLDAARLESGRLTLQLDRNDLSDVVHEAWGRARVGAPGLPQREFHAEVPPGCVGTWDRTRLVRAVRALLANALIYGDGAQPVRATARREDSRVRLEVTGGGPGPDAEEVQHLFERFYRGRSAAESGQSGSGLGLFVARGIARVHGGDVRRLRGDVFELELPLSQATLVAMPG
jgi:signal transduction histidine kinase